MIESSVFIWGRQGKFRVFKMTFLMVFFYEDSVVLVDTPVLVEQMDSLSDLTDSLMQNHGYFSCNAFKS